MAYHLQHFLDQLLPQEHAWKIKLFRSWDSIIGELKVHVRIESIVETTLVLGVSHSVWAQELYFFSDMLIKKINTAIGRECIKTIRFKTISFKKSGSSYKKNKEYSEGLAWQKTKKVPLSAQELLSLSQIKDEDLRKALCEYYKFTCKGT